MQTNGWLVKDVENANEARANLRCETNALRFASRKRGCGAVNGQIAEANVNKESGTLADLLDDRFRNGALALPQRLWKRVDPWHEFADRHRGHFGNVSTVDTYSKDFGL